MKNLEFIRSAGAYRFTDRIALHSQAQTPSAAIACDPYLILPLNASKEDLGRAVLSVLEGYQAEVPHVTDWKQVSAAFVRGVGAKSNRQLQQSSVRCGIWKEGEQLFFQPTHNGGTSGDTKGFQGIETARFSVPARADADEIGAALLRGFDLCTTIYDDA